MRKRIFRILTVVIAVTIISSVSVIGSSNQEVKEKIRILTEEFNKKKSILESDGYYSTDSEEAKEVKQLGIQISDLREQVKTEADYKEELESFLSGCKAGLHDTKKDNRENYDEEVQKFIDKMEAKISRIEAEKEALDLKNKQIESGIEVTASPNYSYRELLEQLQGGSDVD